MHTVPTPTWRTPSPGRLRACATRTVAHRPSHGCTGPQTMVASGPSSSSPRRSRGNASLPSSTACHVLSLRISFHWWGMLREYPLFVALDLRTRIEHDHVGTLQAFFQNWSEARPCSSSRRSTCRSTFQGSARSTVPLSARSVRFFFHVQPADSASPRTWYPADRHPDTKATGLYYIKCRQGPSQALPYSGG